MEKDEKKDKISVIVPIYNERENVADLLLRLRNSLLQTNLPFEIIFVDDGSNDGTYEYLKTSNEKNIVVLKKTEKKGKAYSIVEGFNSATGSILVMIDADLQYSPEQIPRMVEKLKHADIVIANRKKYSASLGRKILSRTFRYAFGGLLFGLSHDIQSGLKVLKKEVFETARFTPRSPWTFDLEFLLRSREAGYKIRDVDIEFKNRKEGFSSVHAIKQTFEIGLNALFLMFKRIDPFTILPKNEKGFGMLGAGIGHRKKRYVTHTTLSNRQSALETFTLGQKVVALLIVFLISLGIVQRPLLTVQAFIAVLSFIYFLDVFFNLYLVLKSLNNESEISFSKEELDSLGDEEAPVYTILCPLYREARVVPQFLDSISKLDWPKNKLDVILLLEEDDTNTIEAIRQMKLPSFVRVEIVPHSIPKTKPKACNYGLHLAKGEYLVIYDAEDIPDPLQLKKAYLGFQKVSSKYICLQAKLNYYNLHQNLLTRFFTAEYSLWFDITLTGLQSLETSIPLGGTSNHFRTSDLKKLEGWDAFNVTEDADLGVRLFKTGYKTAIIDSTTLEEANSNLGNWLRQRSRWIKGYMQTFLVHNRDPLRFMRQRGTHAFIFQLVVGGKVAFILINPFLWIMTISYFALNRFVGPSIEALYPAQIFYIAAFSLVFGNFLFMYYYMIGCMKRQQWSLIKYVFFIPLYWLLISIGGFVALYQLLFKPHYWEKTIHGFHLNSNNKLIPQLVTVQEENIVNFPITTRFQNILYQLTKNKNVFVGGAFLILSSFIADFLNFLFNAYLGRSLTFNDFALLALVSGFYNLISIPTLALASTINYRSSYLIGKHGENVGYQFYLAIRKHIVPASIIFSSLWLLSSPFLMRYFNTKDIVPFVFFTPIVLTGFILASDRGFLSSKFMFGSLAAITMIEPVVKLGAALGLLKLHLPGFAYAAIPLSFFGAFVLAFILVFLAKPKKLGELVSIKELLYFPKSFYLASLFAGLSTLSFLSFDIILAKHYLSPDDAGRYALLSLVGKMVFFLGSVISPFIIPIIGRNEGAKKDSMGPFLTILLTTCALSFVGFVMFGIFGKFTVPLLYGTKASAIIPYLIPFCSAIVCFNVARVFVTYHLVKKNYIFPAVAFLFSLSQIVVTAFYHQTLASFVAIMMALGGGNFILMLILHVTRKSINEMLGPITKEGAHLQDTISSILIFNWRDTKHSFAGGAEVYIHELAKRWFEKGHRVTVFCGNDGKCLEHEVIDGVEIYRKGGFLTVYVWAFLYYMLKFRKKYDIILDSHNGIPFFTPLYASERVKCLMFHVHQEVFHRSLIKPLALYASFLENKCMPFVYRKIKFISISNSTKESMESLGLGKSGIDIIHPGVDINNLRPGRKKDTPLVLYLGRLKYYKSIHVFIHAARKVIEKIPKAEFLIAGDGEEKGSLEKLVKKLNLKGKINFLGKVVESEKIKLYQSAWIFVNPSFIEGWGITTIEANACGTPVVASNVPGLRDSVQNPHTGFLVPYGDSDKFAERISLLIEDHDLRLEMSKNAVEWAKQFDWNKASDEFLEVLYL